MLPDISVIGDVRGAVGSNEDNPLDNQLELYETEVVFGANIYPGVRGDLIVSLHQPDFSAEVEEGYVTFEQLTSAAPIGARLGIVRLPFGKVNQVHPHQLPYADMPAVIENLLGDHFTGNGFEAIGLLPAGGSTFLQAQLGRWEPRAHDHDHDDHAHANGAGFDPHKRLTLGRLWGGASLGERDELELGISGAFGDGYHEEDDGAGGVTIHRPELDLFGVDVTWRRWLPGERRLLLQGEAVRRQETHDDGEQVRQHGFYLLGTFRPNTLYEVGTRYDWSEVPEHAGEHESYISLFGTRFLNETTFLRLQGKHGTNLHGEKITEALLQVVFGFGPHAHVLQ
jgi:hypothetical protein